MTIRHGSHRAYDHHKCRCDKCKAFKATYYRERRADYASRRVEIDGRLVAAHLPPERHCTWNTYSRYGCRCEPCAQAARAAIDRRKATPTAMSAEARHTVDEYQHMRDFGMSHNRACERIGVDPSRFRDTLRRHGLDHLAGNDGTRAA